MQAHPRLSISSDDTLNDTPSSTFDGLHKIVHDALVSSPIDTTNAEPRLVDFGDSKQVWVPRQHSNRTLVLCFDGTGDQFDSDVSHFLIFVS